jgi:hypothetical protein
MPLAAPAPAARQRPVTVGSVQPSCSGDKLAAKIDQNANKRAFPGEVSMTQITIILALLLGTVSYATAEEQNKETQKIDTQTIDKIETENIQTLSATLEMYNRLMNPPKSDLDILPASPANSGVRIFKGTWNAMNHADSSYQAFTDAKNKLGQSKLGQSDFYYSLEIVPQFTGKFADCHSTPNFFDYLRALFGVSVGTLVLVKTDVDYRWTQGSRAGLLTGDSGLLIAGRDAGFSSSSAAGASGNGCLFDTTLRPTFPLLQYGGGGQNDHFDDFSFKFIVIGGSTTTLNAVASIVGLFSNFSAAARVVNPLAGPAAAGAENAATAFQTALQKAGTLQNQISVNYLLKAYAPEPDGITDKNSVAIITIPSLFGPEGNNGNLVIYVRRYGSLVLAKAGHDVKLETVFDNQELSNRQCNPVMIAQGSCNSANNITPIREVLASLLQNIDTGAGTPPPGLDPKNPVGKIINISDPSHQQKTYDICRGITTVSRTVLHLSTLDEMLIRWATTAESGLQKALKNGPGPEKPDEWAKKFGAPSLAELKRVCWDADTAAVLSAVLATMGKIPDPPIETPPK